MDLVVFGSKLDRLREGEMILPPQESNDLGKEARKGMPELLRYTGALEAGYRVVCEERDRYRRQERVRKATVGKIAGRMWSEGACLGYAVMGLRGANFKPDEAVRVLEAMGEAMELYDLETAARAHQDLIEGRRTPEETGARILRSAQNDRDGRCGHG